MNDFPESENPFASPQTTEPMSAATVTSPASSVEELPSRWLRLGAAIIDSLLVGVISFPVGMVMGFAFVAAGSNMDTVASQILLNVFGFLLGIGVFMAVNGYLLHQNGQTVGKMACGIKIVGYDDRQLKSLGHIMLLRVLPITFVAQIPLVGPIVGLVNALMIFNTEKRCLHDFIAGTIVVKA